MLGIIGAMHEEVVELIQLMKNIEEEKIVNLTFFKGKLCGKDIVLVEGGIGKVNAAVCTTLLVSHFKVDKVIFTGVAGAVNPDLEVGDIVVSTELIQHDFDVTSFGIEPGMIPRMKESFFKADESLVELAKNVAYDLFTPERVKSGRILSGDQFIACSDKLSWLKETFNGECTEMEGASVAQVCYLFNVPFVVIRSISDKANHDAKVDFAEFVKLASKNSKDIVVQILEKLDA